MKFQKYQHVEKYGTAETEGIQNGTCYIFPKIDGTNSSVWMEGHEIHAGSRNRSLTLEEDNAGFYSWALKQENIIQCLSDYAELRLYGEWLVPHSLKTYSDDAWKQFYVFDVMDSDGNYIEYDIYKVILDEYNIEYIPPIGKIENPTYEGLVKFLDRNDYLIKDGEGTGEGIVIKNYDFINRFGRVTWAKIVSNDFKTTHRKTWKVSEFKEKEYVEDKIVEKYVDIVLVDKVYYKICTDMDGWSSKYIPRLLQTVFYDLVTEESWNFVKENKMPLVDFSRLNHMTIQKVKDLKPEVF